MFMKMQLFLFSLLAFSGICAKEIVDVIDRDAVIEQVLKGKFPKIPAKFSDSGFVLNSQFEINVISEDMLKAFFAEVKSKKSRLQYGYFKAGCEARAHEIARMFDRHSIESAKIFINGPLYFRGEKWSYHVAILTFVYNEKSKEVTPYVIDPAVNSDEALMLSRWRSAIGVSFSKSNYVVKKYIYRFEDLDLSLDAYRHGDLLKMEKDLGLLKLVW